MKIMISTFGTRGDIQPFIALGRGLKAVGHTVTVCAPEPFKGAIEEHGLQYAHMNSAFFDLMQTEAGRAAFDNPRKALSLLREIIANYRRLMHDEYEAAQSCQPNLMIYHPKTLGSYHIAEKLQIPAFLSIPLPFYTPTREFPNPTFSGTRLGDQFNLFTYRLMALTSAPFAGLTNEFRINTLGLPSRSRFASPVITSSGEPVPVLYPYSKHVVPVPADFPAHAHVTGYWFLDRSDDWQPEAELTQFLASSPPPVYVGFGSMSGNKAKQRARIVIDALVQSGQRGILASGWGGLDASDVPENILVVNEAPHDWLFERVAAVVHHGGAGTTAAGLRAGKPTVICPFLADQPFWGKVVHQLGVGPQPIPQRKLTVARLANAIATAVHDTSMQQRAAELGEKIRAEDGVANAVDIIGTTMGVARRYVHASIVTTSLEAR